ncbi:MAG TPA: 30S ribosomal protein S20 [Bacillota bacterium]|nr:30S ribosomal protein S20 [Bacillota bacterium]
MPNIKSAEKRVKVSAENNARNVSKRSSLRTAVKKFEGAPSAEALPATMQALDKAVTNGTIHKNAAARKKSRLAKKLNAAQ